ncbi:hypothetical protein CIPAW_04G168000 [Carya illinoinensis]|uniref:Uncharacterized protein n=1 Tax=Carya illinoinensis TaxID=32201 RepID=A0A8T1QU10_CARIL|nr:hypothetical protein CIPAW_04G168000 [Carya illinoinensis]
MLERERARRRGMGLRGTEMNQELNWKRIKETTVTRPQRLPMVLALKSIWLPRQDHRDFQWFANIARCLLLRLNLRLGSGSRSDWICGNLVGDGALLVPTVNSLRMINPHLIGSLNR